VDLVVFGGFVQSCGGGSSSYKLEEGGSSSSASSTSAGCCGIRIGGGDRRNQKAEDDDDPNAVIAQAMNILSVQEREHAYEDMHGVSSIVHETPELIVGTLDQMQLCLEKIKYKPAYNLAIAIQADYVRDPKLRLMFLRADRFDPELAAKRLIKFFDWKLKIFGKEKLCQWHIGYNDLDTNARIMVESGSYQVLPERDNRGRAILVVSANCVTQFHQNPQSLLQMTYYFCMSFASDETNQISGVVTISYGLGQDEPKTNTILQTQSSAWDNTLLVLCMPLRYEATHFCSPKRGMHFTVSWIVKAAGVFSRARSRIHFGSPMECEYALLSFGVPSHLLPFTAEGQLKTGNHKKWIQRRIIMERELQRGQVFSGIELPRPNDVLLGRGRPLQNHPGNRRLLELANIYLDEYFAADPDGDRKDVARKIVSEVLHPSSNGQQEAWMYHIGGVGGGRFLQRREDQWNSGWWEEVTDERIMIAKASEAVRGIRKRNVIIAGRETIARTTY
jgi:hypothetical protein